MAKIFVFGTEGSQIESSSFIGGPSRAKRTAPFTRSSRGAIDPPQKATKPSYNEAIKPSHHKAVFHK
ncbi:hypothetical protein TNCV_3843991 [Trichonephila clavipes]|nr:hypothetical protein TNCV_3843991 [Trichonephila clavipes]